MFWLLCMYEIPAFCCVLRIADLAVQLGVICSPAVIFVLSFGSLLFLCYTAPCVKKCPEKALYFDDEGFLYHKQELEIQYADRKEPAIYSI